MSTQDQSGSTKHNRDKSNPGELGAFLLALLLVAALALGFVFNGVAGLTMVMVVLVPLIYVVLILISVGK
jgi:hypothetical protein